MDNGNTQNFELDQLNLDTSSEDWGNNAQANAGRDQIDSTQEHSRRTLGNAAIATPEAEPSQASQSPTSPKLGEITPTMPPGYETPAQDFAPNLQTTDQSDSNSQLTHTVQKALNDEELTLDDVKNIEDSANNLEIDEFYEIIRPEPKESKWNTVKTTNPYPFLYFLQQWQHLKQPIYQGGENN